MRSPSLRPRVSDRARHLSPPDAQRRDSRPLIQTAYRVRLAPDLSRPTQRLFRRVPVVQAQLIGAPKETSDGCPTRADTRHQPRLNVRAVTEALPRRKSFSRPEDLEL